MLDTNTVSYIVRNRSPAARMRLEDAQDISPVYVSAITEGEILFGLAKRPAAHQVAHFMHAALAGLKVLPWNSQAAAAYGKLRARNESLGIAVGSLDMLIAAHAVAEDAVLVTNDGAIAKLEGGPVTVNWADDLRPN
jgi:tRNA(fMet)-specific endonuclease VapC